VSDRVARLLSRYVEHHVMTGERLDAGDLCADVPDLLQDLQQAIDRYEALDRGLDFEPGDAPTDVTTAEDLPTFEGFRTVERIGGGGMGTVYKLHDEALGRTVAAKVLRADSDRDLAPTAADVLDEAAALALFQDRRIVQIHEFRADPPAIIMEFVDGFELGRTAGSLEYAQRARILEQVCEAIEHAHRLGIQHRDLKPSNIMLDPSLEPRILDFGLAGGDPGAGHGVGTLPYLAPEQLDPDRPIDARTDVYALGVVLYELLCGATPYDGEDDEALIAAIRLGRPRLPVEIEPDAPEPLQAIALKAMEPDPGQRYSSAREMALELRRFLDGRPVLARPSLYSSALERRLRPHLEQIEEWLRLKLIYPEEARRLRAEYARLEAREDDWIVESRQLSYAQISLYIGALLLVIGGLLYFIAHRMAEGVDGWLGPAAVLGLPLVGLNVAALALYRRQHRAVAVAFALGAVPLLPLLMMILLAEVGLFPAPPGDSAQLLGVASNCQLQLAAFASACWTGVLAWRTRTTALSSVFTLSTVLLWTALMGDWGLRDWVAEGRWDHLALRLVPLAVVLGLGGRLTEVRSWSWATKPLVLACALVSVIALEIAALDGRAMGLLGLSTAAWQRTEVAHPLLLDTLTVMTANGLIVYAAGVALDRYGSAATRPASWLLLTVSPFLILEPVAWLCGTGDYALGFDWLYLVLALAVTVLSRHQQRRSFYFGGQLNVAIAIFLITSHQEWFDDGWWPAAVIGAGLAVLAVGLGCDVYDRLLRRR